MLLLYYMIGRYPNWSLTFLLYIWFKSCEDTLCVFSDRRHLKNFHKNFKRRIFFEMLTRYWIFQTKKKRKRKYIFHLLSGKTGKRNVWSVVSYISSARERALKRLLGQIRWEEQKEDRSGLLISCWTGRTEDGKTPTSCFHQSERVASSTIIATSLASPSQISSQPHQV